MFKDINECEILFGIKMWEIGSIKAFNGFVNTVLKEWGLHIKFTEKCIRDKKTKKVISEYEYNLDYYKNIKIYI